MKVSARVLVMSAIFYICLISVGCGKSVSDVFNAGKCSSNSDCKKTEICNNSACETAFNRVYRVTVEDASLNYNSHTADADFSNPDPYVGIFFPDMNGMVALTSTKTDTLVPLWNEYAEVTVTADGQSLWFCMGDEDDPTRISDDSLYFSGTDYCKGFENILDFIRVGEASISGLSSSDVNYLNVSIAPK